MDMDKIGKFIANKRKEKGLTQIELADKLNITDRAVSKWECGKSLPDSSIMLELCKILDITVNELLSGEEQEMQDYNKQVELKLVELVRQKEEADKRLLNVEIVLMIISILFLFAAVAVFAFVELPSWAKILILVGGFVQLIIAGLISFRIEQKAGYYECKHCHNRYVPTYSRSIIAPHIGRSKYMKCPSCHRWSWHKKEISK